MVISQVKKTMEWSMVQPIVLQFEFMLLDVTPYAFRLSSDSNK